MSFGYYPIYNNKFSIEHHLDNIRHIPINDTTNVVIITYSVDLRRLGYFIEGFSIIKLAKELGFSIKKHRGVIKLTLSLTMKYNPNSSYSNTKEHLYRYAKIKGMIRLLKFKSRLYAKAMNNVNRIFHSLSNKEVFSRTSIYNYNQKLHNE